MNNVFYFILKVLSVLKIFRFCPEFFGHVGKRLDKKSKVKIKLLTSHILADISRSKSKQTFEIGQLITEYILRNIFLQKSGRK